MLGKSLRWTSNFALELILTQVVTGVSLGLALALAAIRTYLRLQKFRRLFVDDYFLFFAALCLIAGSSLLYVELPYIYTQVNVESGLQALDAGVIQDLVMENKLAYPVSMLLWAAIFSVKFSFLFLFKSLIRRVRHLTILWWFVLAVLIPSAIVCICALFIACSKFSPSFVGLYLMQRPRILLSEANFLRKLPALLQKHYLDKV